MNKLLYILGWVGIASLPIAIIVILILALSGSGGSVWPLLVWTPFVFIKGLQYVRKHKEEMKINRILERAQEGEHDDAR